MKKEFLQTGPPDQIVAANPGNRQMGRKIGGKIPADSGKSFLISVFLYDLIRRRGQTGRKFGNCLPFITAVKADKELFQTDADELGRSRRGIRTDRQRGLIRTVQPAVQVTPGFLNDTGKETTVFFPDVQKMQN